VDETPSVLYKLTSQTLLRYSSWYLLEVLLYRTWADHLHTSWTYWTSCNQQQGRLVGFFGTGGVEKGRIASWPLIESKMFEVFSYRWQAWPGRNLGSIDTWRPGTSTLVKYSLGTNVDTPLLIATRPNSSTGRVPGSRPCTSMAVIVLLYKVWHYPSLQTWAQTLGQFVWLY